MERVSETLAGRAVYLTLGPFTRRETRTRRPEVLFWRTSGGAEVDFVLEATSRLVPIEVKGTNRLRVRDGRHIELFLDEYPDRAVGRPGFPPGGPCYLAVHASGDLLPPRPRRPRRCS